MSKRLVSLLRSEYSMLLVLLLLCAYYSVATIKDRPSLGADGGADCARQLLSDPKKTGNVVIMVGTSSDNAGFVDEATRVLKAGGVTQINVFSGTPRDVRKGLKKLIDSNNLPTAIICTADEAASHDALKGTLPAIAPVPTILPRSHKWPVFVTTSNLLNVSNQIVVIAIIAVGMTMVIITGGIDLSVGSMVALSAVSTGMLISGYAGGVHAGVMGMIFCSLAGILICGLVGAFTGGMITLFKIPPFIITLAMMQVASGRAFKITHGESVYDIPDGFIWLGRGASIAGIPNAVLLMVIVYVVAHITMSRTRLGRYIYAVGGNAEAARLSGVNVSLILMIVYVLQGLLAGLGGIIVTSQLKGSTPSYGVGYELSVIAAVVVGGTSLAGGEGSVIKTLVGALIIGVIQNGMNLTGIEPYSQKEVLGWVILGAVLLDSFKRTTWRLPWRNREPRGFPVQLTDEAAKDQPAPQTIQG